MTKRIITLCFLLVLGVSVRAQTIDTYAGGGPNNMPATAANLNSPFGVAFDGAGNLFVVAQGSQRVFKMDVGTGILTSVAGNGLSGFTGDGGPATSATLNFPVGIAVDAAGNLYIADQSNNRIRKVDAGGVISTVAGNGGFGFSGDGGPATSANVSAPSGVAVDTAGNIYITDLNNRRIRKVNASGTISTFAGNGVSGFGGDGGPATLASFNGPRGLAVDAAGNLYIADQGNHRIRKIDTATGIISTFAGSASGGFSGDGGPATLAQLNGPFGVSVDAFGIFCIADSNNNRIRKVNAGGIISTVAGSGPAGFLGDGGPATSARLNGPRGMALDASGNIYIADLSNNRVRKVAITGTISTFAGNGTVGFSGDGGPATRASLNLPPGVALDAAGNLYIADQNNQRIRKVTSGGTISTVAGDGTGGFSGDGGLATSARLNGPVGVTVDSTGNIYIAELNNSRIRKVNTAGIISTVAGNGTFAFSGDGGAATSAALNNPRGVTVDAVGNIYVADSTNQRIRKVNTSGVISTVAGNGTSGFSGDGGPATSARLNNPIGVATDGSNNIYVANSINHRIRKVDAGGTISTIAGNGSQGFTGDSGPATSGALNTPRAVVVDAAGNIYIADSANNRIRKVTPSGMITTAAGNGSLGFSGDGGPATSAALANPSGVGVDASGNLYVADLFNHRVRRVQFIVDLDGDGILDASDNCPTTPNSNQLDTDSDGQGDVCDTDDDNDGVLDATDNCSLVANSAQTDTDNDGQGDVCDTDDDNDGVLDAADNCSLVANSAQTDTDNDGQGDACDSDDDNDGVLDAADNCSLVANSAQTDTDSDGQGDACDSDDDNDAVLDATDNCSLVANSAQTDTDNDGQGDVCDSDDDNDTVADGADNCQLVSNTDQANNDGDALGDVCDADDDNDSLLDNADNCPLTANPDQRDTDGDGVGDVCDANGIYRTCLLYDQNKLHKSGSVVPIKLQLCDANGINQSSADKTVTAIGVMKVSDAAFGTVEDAGNSNPDSNFRFNVDQYQFNLKTTGLTTGTYVLGFRVSSETFIYTVQFKVK